MPIRSSELQGLKPWLEHSTHNVSTGEYKGEKGFFKQLNAAIGEPRARNLRLLNEALCAKVVEILNRELGNPFSTPTYSLVVEEKTGALVGIFCPKIIHENLEEWGGTHHNKLLALMRIPGLAELSAIRFFLRDIDGHFNIGCGEEGKGLASLDYGLANACFLLKLEDKLNLDLLYEGERDAVVSALSTSIFQPSDINLFAAMVSPRAESERCLTQHAFPAYLEGIKLFCTSHNEVASKFFKEVERTNLLIVRLLTDPRFENRARAELGIDTLCSEDRADFDLLLGSVLEMAKAFKSIFLGWKKASPKVFEALVKKDEIAPEIAPTLLNSSSFYKTSQVFASINSTIQGRQSAEAASASGRITPANGGGLEGYQEIIAPRSYTPRI